MLVRISIIQQGLLHKHSSIFSQVTTLSAVSFPREEFCARSWTLQCQRWCNYVRMCKSTIRIVSSLYYGTFKFYTIFANAVAEIFVIVTWWGSVMFGTCTRVLLIYHPCPRRLDVQCTTEGRDYTKPGCWGTMPGCWWTCIGICCLLVLTFLHLSQSRMYLVQVLILWIFCNPKVLHEFCVYSVILNRQICVLFAAVIMLCNCTKIYDLLCLISIT